MADTDQPNDPTPPGLPVPGPVPPAPVPPSPTPPGPTPSGPGPSGVDPALVEQFRQFQEFQQFQAFQRYQESQPQLGGAEPSPGQHPHAIPPGPPSAPQPALPGAPAPEPGPWERFGDALLKMVKTRLFRRLILLAILLLVALTVWQNLFGSDEDTPAQPPPPGAKTNAGGLAILSNSAAQTIQFLYDGVVNDRPNVCTYFSEDAKRQFADLHGGGSCPETVTRLSAQVTDKSAYIPGTIGIQGRKDVLPISSCALHITGGPSLGKLTLTLTGGGYLITSFEPETC